MPVEAVESWKKTRTVLAYSAVAMGACAMAVSSAGSTSSVLLQTDPPHAFEFEIEPGIKEQLLKGMDDIAQTLQHETDIARFEESHDPLGP